MDENLEVEELSTEEKKKAINLQDLVYVKKYIDGRHYSKDETEAVIDTKVATAKEEMDTAIDAAIEASSKSYTKEESDELYYRRTNRVEKAYYSMYVQNGGTDGGIGISVHVLSEADYDWRAENNGAYDGTLYFCTEE